MAKFTIPEIKGVVAGEFGKIFVLTLKDFDGVAQDISSFDSTKTVYARHDDTDAEASATVVFDSDGTDGKVTFSWASGDIDRAGLWHIQIVMTNTGGSKKGKTLPSPMRVEPAYDG